VLELHPYRGLLICPHKLPRMGPRLGIVVLLGVIPPRYVFKFDSSWCPSSLVNIPGMHQFLQIVRIAAQSFQDDDLTDRPDLDPASGVDPPSGARDRSPQQRRRSSSMATQMLGEIDGAAINSSGSAPVAVVERLPIRSRRSSAIYSQVIGETPPDAAQSFSPTQPPSSIASQSSAVVSLPAADGPPLSQPLSEPRYLPVGSISAPDLVKSILSYFLRLSNENCIFSETCWSGSKFRNRM
jgi:hypothetical protein